MPRANTKNTSDELPIVQLDVANRGKKSGRWHIRATVLILVHVLIIAHITHFYLYGRSVSPLEPSESMYTLELGHLNAGAILFGLAILSTVVFGRFFCGWTCHLIALQDLSSYLLRRIGIRPKPLRSRMLAFVPFAVAFYMFFWPTVQRLWQGNPHPGFSNHLLTEDFWRTFPGPFVSILTFVVCGGLVVYLLGNKGFCTYACPYGAFFTVSDMLAAGRIRVTDACQQCGKCTAACTSNVSVSQEVKDFGMVVDPGCMKCMDCVSACPNDALYFGFKQKNKLPDAKPSRRKTYDYSIAEEICGLIIAAATVYALRGLYNVIPFLLSVALGVITAYLAIQCWRIFRKRDLRIQNLQLKRNNRITTTGGLVIVLCVVWFAFTIHSFCVQYFRYHGRDCLAQIDVVWDDLFLAGQSARKFTPEEDALIDTALKSFQFSDHIGFMNVYEVKVGLAVSSMAKNDMEAAEFYLRQAHDLNPSAIRSLLAEYLASQGRSDEAKELLKNE